MQHIIAKLVEDFEQGKISRRQLIQSLTVAATAACAAIAAPAGGRKGFQAVAVNHISYQVHDYTKIRDFYADLLGMRVTRDTGKECHLLFGDSFLIPRNHSASAPRIDHIAYTIDNWSRSAVEAELKARRLNPRPDTENSFHVQDPAGFDLQISGKEMQG
ncbi:MAG TPA: VOC family protein [Bryobacteraceae bacterium]|nr:VOC family protein [Bryobacteraceae bacterium]